MTINSRVDKLQAIKGIRQYCLDTFGESPSAIAAKTCLDEVNAKLDKRDGLFRDLSKSIAAYAEFYGTADAARMIASVSRSNGIAVASVIDPPRAK